MQYVHLTADHDGVSRFGDVEIPLEMSDFAPPAPQLLQSASEPVRHLLYLTLPVGWFGDQHPSPRRQVAFCLGGRLRVTAGDGEVREVEPGGIWRMEDTTGPGHVTEVIGDEPARLAIVQLE